VDENWIRITVNRGMNVGGAVAVRANKTYLEKIDEIIVEIFKNRPLSNRAT